MSQKRKHSNEHNQLVINVDTWLQEAQHDTEAVWWFTRTILHQTTTTTHSYKRPKTLNMLHNHRTTTLNRLEDLTCRHLHAAMQAYPAPPPPLRKHCLV